jgi:hypothetical protein
MSTYLIKRNPAFSNTGVILKKTDKKKGYSEVLISAANKEPYPKELQIGDAILVADNDSGIYARGIVLEIPELRVFESINKLIEHAQKSNDEKFWMSKLSKFYNAKKENSNSKFYFKEYFIEQTLLTRTIPLDGVLSRLSKKGLAASIIKLDEDETEFVNNPIFTETSKIHGKIPSNLRMDLYSFFNKNYSISHWIDIDHFVPYSAGGPGNIIENLVPIGFSLNRYKSDSIPRGFFVIAEQYEDFKNKINKKWLNCEHEFLKNKDYPNSKQVCLEINKIINHEWTIEKSKQFYRNILNFHDSKYVEIIDEFNSTRSKG